MVIGKIKMEITVHSIIFREEELFVEEIEVIMEDIEGDSMEEAIMAVTHRFLSCFGTLMDGTIMLRGIITY
jgi:hypothetical protein